MFGIRFEGHPGPAAHPLGQDWEGHPLLQGLRGRHPHPPVPMTGGRAAMIYELRTYTLLPGKQGEYLKLNARGRPQDPRRQVRQARGLLVHRVRHAEPARAPLELSPTSTSASGCAASSRRTRRGPRSYVPQIRPHAAGPGEQDPVARCVPLKPPADTGNVYELRWYRAHVGQAGRVARASSRAILPAPREVHRAASASGRREVGQLNEVVHMWVYSDLNERAAARAKARPGSRLAGVPRQVHCRSSPHMQADRPRSRRPSRPMTVTRVSAA